MTIYQSFLSRGYFPKELPPSFFTEHFSAYATSTPGRAALNGYKPPDNYTECVAYSLAIPGLNYRPLRIPHPFAFHCLARITAKNFRRLLKKAGSSNISKSRPVYEEHQRRALRTLVKPSNLARERAIARGGAAYLLKVDVSQFYPSLYTHAIGWAVDSKLRNKSHWQNSKLLGKQIDQCLMNLQGKVSQGIPIGNDISFLLAETVLAQVDKAMKTKTRKGYRWFDDYEFACSTRSEAEEILSNLQKLLETFRLRINPKKTQIIQLPQPASDHWQDQIIEHSETAFNSPHTMVKYFDAAFHLSSEYVDHPVLLYAIGALFKKHDPRPEVLRVAESCITQAMISEPGCAQKGFSLLQYWSINQCDLDTQLLVDTVEQIVLRHERRGASSDVAWALAFTIAQGLRLSKKTGRALTSLKDDIIAIQSLHAYSLGLIDGFSSRGIENFLSNANPDGNHWLALYESVRQGFLPSLQPKIVSNSLLNNMLNNNVAFYRPNLRPYSLVLHFGGAPDWIARGWISQLIDGPVERLTQLIADNTLMAILRFDIQDVPLEEKSEVDIILDLLGRSEPDNINFEYYA